MGDVRPVDPVLLIVAAFSNDPAALAWARQRASETWGPIALESEAFEFVETEYYAPTMGPRLRKCFWAHERRIDPAALCQIKLQTNAWEAEYASSGRHAQRRPLNLDPGYLTAAKLVLASTKDHAHRIYVDRGIFAEITLYYRDRQWQHHEWTFPDYRRADYQAFFSRLRDYLRGRERS